jgi:acetyl/propionyl-CoA carboxylase alpha subunit
VKKILVANRGEIACRVIRSARRLGIATTAVYSEADANALHVRSADEAMEIGPGPARQSYLSIERILDAARASGADAVHPGYGFLAEQAGFAEAVERAGLTWIGPTSQSIAAMGDKQRARDIAVAAGLRVLPGSRRFAEADLAGLDAAAAAVGYPVLVKATAGGGGIGMRRVDRPADLIAAAQATRTMAEKAFGDGTVYLERFIPVARHIEVQVFGLGDGNAVHLFERDCSIQRRFQKIIEESPAPGLPGSVRDGLAEAAVLLSRHERYRGAGTVEFIVDAESFEFFFLEMNTRIQVEHPVTEMTTGLDLVAMQIDHARGRLAAIDQSSIAGHGHAIECRLYAENPKKNFLPSPGTLTSFVLPTPQAGVRVDTGYGAGDTISFHYDALLAKIICHGADRADALGRMATTLDTVTVEGVSTNLSFLRRAIVHPAFHGGALSTRFVDENLRELVD